MNSNVVTYRPPNQTDLQFVIASWLKSTRNSDFCTYIPNPTYYKYMDHLIKTIINRSLVTMICDPEDLSHIYGYIVYEFLGDNTIFVLHFAYMKLPYRKLHIMEAALTAVYPDFGKEDSFITNLDRTNYYTILDRVTNKPIVKRDGWFIKKRNQYKLNYNPFLLVR